MAGFQSVFVHPDLGHRGPPERILGHVAADDLRKRSGPPSRHASVALHAMFGQALSSDKRPEPHFTDATEPVYPPRALCGCAAGAPHPPPGRRQPRPDPPRAGSRRLSCYAVPGTSPGPGGPCPGIGFAEKIGDTVHARVVVQTERDVDNRDRGIVTFAVTLFNQREEPVQVSGVGYTTVHDEKEGLRDPRGWCVGCDKADPGASGAGRAESREGALSSILNGRHAWLQGAPLTQHR